MVNVKEQKLGKNTRMSFSRSRFNLELPNLVEIQTKSFDWFLEEGLKEVLRDVSPITDYSGNLSIDFISYSSFFPRQFCWQNSFLMLQYF